MAIPLTKVAMPERSLRRAGLRGRFRPARKMQQCINIYKSDPRVQEFLCALPIGVGPWQWNWGLTLAKNIEKFLPSYKTSRSSDFNFIFKASLIAWVPFVCENFQPVNFLSHVLLCECRSTKISHAVPVSVWGQLGASRLRDGGRQMKILHGISCVRERKELLFSLPKRIFAHFLNLYFYFQKKQL